MIEKASNKHEIYNPLIEEKLAMKKANNGWKRKGLTYSLKHLPRIMSI